jgi:hypothetical protein
VPRRDGVMMLKLGSNVSMSDATVSSTEVSPLSVIWPLSASSAATVGCSATPTSAAFGPEIVSWLSGEAPRARLLQQSLD